MSGRTLEQLSLPIPEPKAQPAPAPEPEPFPDLDETEEAPFEIEPELSDLPQRRRALPSPDALQAQATALADAVSRRLDRPVRLSVTDNRSTMVSYRREDDLLLLRVHHMFLGAPENIVRAIADYAGRGRRHASALIDAWVREHTKTIRVGHRKDPKARLQAQGKVFDLREILDRINDRCFGGRIEARIGWGRAPTGARRRRTIRMGVYDHLTKTIRVHPALDQPEVPLFFVEYIVFHEMLHQAIPGAGRDGRRQHHGPEFRKREKLYPDYARALAWERDNLSLLLGRPVGKLARPVD